MTLRIATEHRGAATIVSVGGSIDALTADALLQTLTELIKSGHIRLVAAFDEVDYTSSAGLRVLLSALKDTRQQGGDLRLAGVQERVRKVLDLSGFTNLLKVYADVGAAVASYTA